MRELDVRHVSDVAPPSPVPVSVASGVIVLADPVIDLTTTASAQRFLERWQPENNWRIQLPLRRHLSQMPGNQHDGGKSVALRS